MRKEEGEKKEKKGGAREKKREKDVTFAFVAGKLVAVAEKNRGMDVGKRTVARLQSWLVHLSVRLHLQGVKGYGRWTQWVVIA